MISRIRLSLLYFFLWIAYFFIARVIFLIYYLPLSRELDSSTLLKILFKALPLDFSMSAYLSAIPFLLIACSSFIPIRWIKTLIFGYTLLIFLSIHLLFFGDIGIYHYWGIRIDASGLMYVATPKEMFASLPTWKIIIGVIAFVGTAFLCLKYFNKVLNFGIRRTGSGTWFQFPVLLLLTAALIIPIRGGFQTIPVNQSNVYFSNELFANHAAVNFAWNFFHSLEHDSNNTHNPYVYMDQDVAEKLVRNEIKALQTNDTDSIVQNILNTEQPNIIVIIWESLTAKVVAPLGGEIDVVAHFNRLCDEGILFTNFYANGDRSDKGLVSIFSGFYPQPTKSIVKIPNKTRTLPMITSKLKEVGYSTSFFYGGDMNFGNMNTYFRNGNIDLFVTGDDFKQADWNSKWGAHDHVLLNQFFTVINEQVKEPFFTSVFTLSSHEPFEFPDDYKFGKETKEDLFRSAHAYTDKYVAQFIAKAKEQEWWDNTLVVILADHGHPMLRKQGEFNGPNKYHIPMLWLGGALNEKGVINDHFTSQCDLPYTLLSLTKGNNKDFVYGKDLFRKSDDHFVHYTFNNGFGTIGKGGSILYDFTADRKFQIEGDQNLTSKYETLGKAFTQVTFQDYLDRK